MCPALVCRVGTKKPWASITLREPGNIRALGYTLGISFSTFIEQLLYIHIRQVSDNKIREVTTVLWEADTNAENHSVVKSDLIGQGALNMKW